MNPEIDLLEQFSLLIQEKLGERLKEYLSPPPVFLAMRGEFLEIDLEHQALTARFPVLESYLNPYGSMQGGMIAAAVDNTLGPLSILVAPPNVTRRLELKYSRGIRLEQEYLVVHARLIERQDRRLYFEATARDAAGIKLATCKAVHWIIETETHQV